MRLKIGCRLLKISLTHNTAHLGMRNLILAVETEN